MVPRVAPGLDDGDVKVPKRRRREEKGGAWPDGGKCEPASANQKRADARDDSQGAYQCPSLSVPNL